MQLLKEHLRQVVIVVLASVNQNRFEEVVRPHLRKQRGHLHHVRPSANDIHDTQGTIGHLDQYLSFRAKLSENMDLCRYPDSPKRRQCGAWTFFGEWVSIAHNISA